MTNPQAAETNTFNNTKVLETITNYLAVSRHTGWLDLPNTFGDMSKTKSLFIINDNNESWINIKVTDGYQFGYDDTTPSNLAKLECTYSFIAMTAARKNGCDLHAYGSIIGLVEHLVTACDARLSSYSVMQEVDVLNVNINLMLATGYITIRCDIPLGERNVRVSELWADMGSVITSSALLTLAGGKFNTLQTDAYIMAQWNGEYVIMASIQAQRMNPNYNELKNTRADTHRNTVSTLKAMCGNDIGEMYYFIVAAIGTPGEGTVRKFLSNRSNDVDSTFIQFEDNDVMYNLTFNA